MTGVTLVTVSNECDLLNDWSNSDDLDDEDEWVD